MTRKYTVLDNEYVQYEENGFTYVIPNDPANSDYQAYLNKDTLPSKLAVASDASTVK
jgi:hypothetical protein